MLFLMAFRIVKNRTIGADEINGRLDMRSLRAEISRRRREHTEKMAKAKLEEDSRARNINSRISDGPNNFSPHVIEWFTPQTIQGRGGESVLLNVVPVFVATVYCKFNSEVRRGWTTVNHSVMCVVPPLRGTAAELSLSADGTRWSRPVFVSVAQDGSSLNWMVGAAVIVAVAYVLKKILSKKSKRSADDDNEGIREHPERDLPHIHRRAKPPDV